MASNTTSPGLRSLVRQHATIVERGGMPEALDAAAAFRKAGVVADCRVGTSPAPGSDDCVEWYAGQFLAIVSAGAWFAVNSWLNCIDKFCPPSAP